MKKKVTEFWLFRDGGDGAGYQKCPIKDFRISYTHDHDHDGAEPDGFYCETYAAQHEACVSDFDIFAPELLHMGELEAKRIRMTESEGRVTYDLLEWLWIED